MRCAKRRRKSTNSLYMQHYKPVSRVHMSMDAYDFTFLPTLAKCQVAVCPYHVRVQHQVSIIPILLYFLQVPWPLGNNVCSTRIFLFNWHYIHIFPKLLVFLITHLSKSFTNTTLGLRFCFFLPGVFRSYSGLLAFLSLCFFQILQMFNQDIHVYMTALQQ